jgi:hypothetical protein
MRTFRAALLLALVAGCHRTSSIDVPEADRIDCATGGATEFSRDCALERSTDAGVLTIHHADGGFRKLNVDPDGTITAADGAIEATGHPLADGRLEVEVGGDRYRLPSRK